MGYIVLEIIFGCLLVAVTAANISTIGLNFNALPFQLPENISWDTSVIGDEQCRNDVEYWLGSVKVYLEWSSVNCSNDENCTAMQQQYLAQNLFAIKQLDSFGKPPANLLGLNILWLGSWDECISVKAENNYAGKFFWITIAPDLKRMGMSLDIDTEITCTGAAQLRWSVCMPERCGDEDITALFQSMNNKTDGMIEFCTAKGSPSKAPKKKFWFWMVCGFCLLVGFLVVVSSLIDYITEDKDKSSYKRFRSNPAIRPLLFFSAYTNGAEILSTKKRPGQIHSLSCIRAVSMTWVVIGHIVMMYQNGENPTNLANTTNYFLNQVFLNAFPSVDSFLFIGGVLLGYLFFKDMQRNPKSLKSPVYWSLYYIHRYLRLSIPYLTFLGFHSIIWPYLIKGPQQLSSDVENCKKYWWRNVLYISTFFPSSEMCMIHSWYLSTDMWIHNFSPILLVPLLLSPIFGGIVALGLMVLTVGATYGVYYKYHFPATTTELAANLAANPDAMVKFMKYVYTAPWIRYIPNLFGILLGYVMYRIGNRKLRINWLLSFALWIVSAAMAIGCIYGLFDYNRKKTTFNDFESASYYVFHRVGWSLALAWTVLACQYNKAGFIKNFMEHGFWMPLARLGYCAYLVHFLVIYVFFSQDRTALHFVGIPATYMHAGIPCFVLSYGFAFVWSCGIEIPFAKLEKMITAKITGTSRRPAATEPAIEKKIPVQSTVVTAEKTPVINSVAALTVPDEKPSALTNWSTDDLDSDNSSEQNSHSNMSSPTDTNQQPLWNTQSHL